MSVSERNVKLDLMWDGDDFVFLSTPDVFGLFLWGPPKLVDELLWPAIEGLLRCNENLELRSIYKPIPIADQVGVKEVVITVGYE